MLLHFHIFGPLNKMINRKIWPGECCADMFLGAQYAFNRLLMVDRQGVTFLYKSGPRQANRPVYCRLLNGQYATSAVVTHFGSISSPRG